MAEKLLNLTIVLLLAASYAQAQNQKKPLIKKIGQTAKSNLKIFLVLDMSVRDSSMYEKYRIGVEPLIKGMGANI